MIHYKMETQETTTRSTNRTFPASQQHVHALRVTPTSFLKGTTPLTLTLREDVGTSLIFLYKWNNSLSALYVRYFLLSIVSSILFPVRN